MLDLECLSIHYILYTHLFKTFHATKTSSNTVILTKAKKYLIIEKRPLETGCLE